MNREEHINAFSCLGKLINVWLAQDEDACDELGGKGLYAAFSTAVWQAAKDNEWFTEQGIKDALAAISTEMLAEVKLRAWLEGYGYNDRASLAKPVGVIAAGNIPLVCFHDIMCVMLSGYGLLLKPSSKDRALIEKIVELLIYFEPKLSERIKLSYLAKREDISALIATGSNNTARYIEYEFAGISILSRKNRTSVAILTGDETEEELMLLGDDIFSYFGMGCRNISKLFLPKGYDFSTLIASLNLWTEKLSRQAKYVGSYRHERAISLSLNEQVINGDIFLLKESKQLNSPLSVIYYEFFSNLESVKNHLIQNADLLQCVAAADGTIGNVRFGQTQKPALSDYADGVDTIQWLTNNIK